MNLTGIWQVNNLFLFLAFFVPGFISLKVYDLIIPNERRDFSKSLADAISYSAIHYAFFFYPIIIFKSSLPSEQHLIYYFAILAFMFVLPIIWPLLFIFLMRKFHHNPTPKPWDFVFEKPEDSWVIVYLKNGNKVGGIFSTMSYTSAHPYSEQIYLEEVWEVDENNVFLNPKERSKGVIILGSEIVSIEFYA